MSSYDQMWDERATLIERLERVDQERNLLRATIREYDKLIVKLGSVQAAYEQDSDPAVGEAA